MRSFNRSHLITDDNWVLSILKMPSQKVFLVLEGLHGESGEYAAFRADLDYIYTGDGQKTNSLKIFCKAISQDELTWLSRQTMRDAPRHTRLQMRSMDVNKEAKDRFDAIVEQSVWDDVEITAMTPVSTAALQSLMVDPDSSRSRLDWMFPDKERIRVRYESLLKKGLHWSSWAIEVMSAIGPTCSRNSSFIQRHPVGAEPEVREEQDSGLKCMIL